METLKVFTAGVAAQLSRIAADRLKNECPDIRCEVVVGGSAEGVRRLLAGERFDVMVLADSSDIEQRLMPELVDGYAVWGGNEMVVMGKGVNAGNWQEKLLDPANELRHMDPYRDPSGYRAVMVLQLADKVKRGLSGRLFRQPKYCGLDRDQYEGGVKERQDGDNVYRLVYKSMAVARGREFAPLPALMNLGDPAYEEIYRTASFEIDGGHLVRGTTILHAITIPKNAPNRAGAEKFAQLFLGNRFPLYGFTPVQRSVGNWKVKPANMWDAEARYYSLMTLMEVNGTNQQLDCMPLEAEDVVLDCGCGPGRIAIQAAKRVKTVICLDNSEGMLEECRRNCAAAGVSNVEFVLADWQEAEIGKTIPEVDVVIQSRGGGGPSSLEMLRKAARKYAVNVMWTDGAPCLPESRGKLFVGCYSVEAQERHPELKPFRRPRGPHPGERNEGRLFGGKGPLSPADKLPMESRALQAALKSQGVEAHTSTVKEGWDKLFPSKEAAYAWLLQLSKYPELVDQEMFRRNVDNYLTETKEGWYFFLPTSSDVTWFKTREN